MLMVKMKILFLIIAMILIAGRAIASGSCYCDGSGNPSDNCAGGEGVHDECCISGCANECWCTPEFDSVTGAITLLIAIGVPIIILKRRSNKKADPK